MLKRMLVLGLAVAVAAGILSSCSSTPKTTTIDVGNLATFVSDVPACGVLNFRSSVQGMALLPTGSNVSFPVFGGLSSRQPTYKIDFGKLRDFSTVMDFGRAPVGTYDRVLFAFLSPTLVTYDSTFSPPIKFIGPKLPTFTPEFKIDPPLIITNGGLAGMQVDFNLRQSVSLDQDGQVASNMTPVMTFTPITPTTTGGFGDLDDVKGFITSVTTTSTGAGFVGGFGFQTLSGSGPLLTVNLTDSAIICGLETPLDPTGACVPLVPPTDPPKVFLNQMLTGSFVEMDGYVDLHGNLIARSVMIEDREAPENKQVGFIGEVVPNSVTRDVNGSVSQFGLYITEEEPDDTLFVPLDTILLINLSPTTVFQADGRPEQPGSAISNNFLDLPFDSTSIKEGQELVVHGIFTNPPVSNVSQGAPQPTTVAADKVFLKLQSHLGNFSSLAAAQGDDKTGGFWLATCGSLFAGAPNAPILVLTNGQTTYLNLVGLSALTPQPTLVIKGLLFYDFAGGTLNGVTVPPGTLVLEAKQVHQVN